MNWWMGKLWARVDITCHVITGNHLKNKNLRKGVEEIKNTEMDIWQFTSKQQWHDKKNLSNEIFSGQSKPGNSNASGTTITDKSSWEGCTT